MNLLGHTLIASKTCDLLEKEYGFSVHRPAFYFGNILPDTSPKMKRPVHRIENWGQQINQMINELETKDFGSSRRFSIKLGIVCHFISDFFCLAHNDPYYRRQLVHLIYEAKQAKKFLSLREKPIDADLPSSIPSDMDASSYLSRRYEEFITQDISFEKELNYSVEVCAVLCSILIAEGLLVPTNA
ncbi:MAG: zinc dependent phospholipase C family protein [Clostridiales bacterium]|nr:zinc dependent phospholipase C family protein [Clostridiales bacterium]